MTTFKFEILDKIETLPEIRAFKSLYISKLLTTYPCSRHHIIVTKGMILYIYITKYIGNRESVVSSIKYWDRR